MCVGVRLFMYSVCASACVCLRRGLAGTVMQCADGEQEGEDCSLQAVVCL